MTFDTQIQALAGTADQSEMDQWMTDGVKEIINILPPELKEKCMTETTLNNSSPTMDLDGVGKILYVSRLSADSGGYRIPCREVPSMYAGLTSDSSNLLYYGTVTDPVYWIQSTSDAAILNVYPSPEATQTARVYHIGYPTINADAVSVIANFPDEAEYLVVLYAACKVLHNKMNEKNGDLPGDVPSPALDETTLSLPTLTSTSVIILPSISVAPLMNEKSVSITGTAPTYTKPEMVIESISISDLTISSSAPTIPSDPAIVSPGVSTVSKADISGDVPTYTKPTFSLDVKPNISNLSINAFAPVVPSSPSFTTPDISSVTLDSPSPPPIYITPTIGGTATELTDMQKLGTANTIDVHDDQADFKQWFATLGHFVEDEEDVELAAAQIQKINAFISAFQAQTGNNLNQFNKDNTVYQADLQKIIQQAQINAQEAQQEANLTLQKENQEYASKIQKYSNEINSYQNQVNKEVQEYQQNFQKEIQLWKENNAVGIQKYAQDIQNELNEFNKENVRYQANVQASIAKFNADVQDSQKESDLSMQANTEDYTLELQLFQQEMALYQANINKEIQEYTNNFQKNLQIWQGKNQANSQKYAQDLTNELNEFNKENAQYQALLQKDLQDASFKESKEGRDLQKYSQELASYQAEVGAKVQEFQTTLQKNLETFNADITKYNSESAKVNADNQSKIGKFAQELASYGAKIQKHNTAYQWYQGQYAMLKQEYNQGIQILVSGGMPQQQKGEG